MGVHCWCGSDVSPAECGVLHFMFMVEAFRFISSLTVQYATNVCEASAV